MNPQQQTTAIVGISTKCNQDCIFCLDSPIKGNKEPTLEEIRQEIKRLKANEAYPLKLRANFKTFQFHV